MAKIFTLTVDVILYIFRFLDTLDRIAFSLTCQGFRRFCVEERVFGKMDFSRCMISTTQRGAVDNFFRERKLTQHIRELNISNLPVLNSQMDNYVEEFIKLLCPQLEALHILNSGIGFERLHRILQEASQLTALSWSIWNLTYEDLDFLVKSILSSEGICFKNIKYLHLQMNESLPQIQIAKYLALSCFRDLEELEICTWWGSEAYCTGRSFPLPADRLIPGFPQSSAENKLQHLHSLTVVAEGDLKFAHIDMLSDFVLSVVRSKSSSTKWKKFWVLPIITGIIMIHLTDLSLLLHEVHPREIQSIEAIGADAGLSANAVYELKTVFGRICDNTVRSLHLCLPHYINTIVEFCQLISRVGGHSLKVLRLSVDIVKDIRADQNVFIRSLFSNCSNITELDLVGYYFEKDICEPLSKLKHLTKVQLNQCAISSKYTDENEVEISKANLLIFVENCKKITHLDIRGGCWGLHGHFSCRLADGDLLALAKLRNLKSLTLYDIHDIREWTFLQNISEHCRFLTMLRISAMGIGISNSHIPILMESAKLLKHLAISVKMLVLNSKVFWNLLSNAKKLERLCIRCGSIEWLKVSVAMQTLKCLPRLRVLHLHSRNIENVDDFYDQLIRMLEEKKSDCRFSFEIVMDNKINTWINHPTGYTLIPHKLLHLNEAELCRIRPILDNPKF